METILIILLILICVGVEAGDTPVLAERIRRRLTSDQCKYLTTGSKVNNEYISEAHKVSPIAEA
jgi:hypothetical protein